MIDLEEYLIVNILLEGFIYFSSLALLVNYLLKRLGFLNYEQKLRKIVTQMTSLILTGVNIVVA